ncbi:hypothetical protein [Pseudomonas fluorescens]|uniref:Uncharacterized protein n=1 Tax=Pseudomonas fluorescens TaxID=294 RepID=A0A5E6ZKP3_PSEFL|nr:hypothetical protein [Pseudomonas fluorescens]VVN64713.1 hypothetical protein PS723_00017 [Pseudomonas fluorescens]
MEPNSYGDEQLGYAIQDLVDEGLLKEGPTSYGIALHDNDHDSLSDAEKRVFDHHVEPLPSRRARQLERQRIIDSNPD